MVIMMLSIQRLPGSMMILSASPRADADYDENVQNRTGLEPCDERSGHPKRFEQARIRIFEMNPFGLLNSSLWWRTGLYQSDPLIRFGSFNPNEKQ